MSRNVRQCTALRKHAYSNILKILPPKTENLQIKSSDIFHISAQNIDCGYSLEPPRPTFICTLYFLFLLKYKKASSHNLCFEQKYEKNIGIFI